MYEQGPYILIAASQAMPSPPPHLRRHAALPGPRQHLLRLEPPPDFARKAEPVEAAGREHDRVEPSLPALAQPRLDVPSQRLDRELGLQREQLRLPPHRRGPD